MPVDELLLREVVAEHLRGAARWRRVRAARSAPTYDVGPAGPRHRRAEVWDAALSAYVRAAAAS